MDDIFYQMLEFNKSGSDELPNIHIIRRLGIDTGMPPHWHEAIEICFVLQNPIISTIDGQIVQIEEGNFGIVNSCCVHRLVAVYPDQFSRSLCIIIPYQMILSVCPEFGAYRFEIPSEHPKRAEIIFSLERIYSLVLNMKTPSREQALINSELWHLIYLLLGFRVYSGEKAVIPTKQHDALAKQAMEYIEKNFREPLTFTEVAQKVGLQENYFCRYFKKYVGMSFGQYLARVRLRYGLSYMLCYNVSVTDSALQAGFPSTKSFIEWCKRVYGVTPSQYKRQHLKGKGQKDSSDNE